MSWSVFLLLSASGFVLQPPGHFHDGEPVVTDGDQMLALHDDGQRAWLEATRIVMERVADEMLDEPGGPETGWRIGPDVDTGLPLAYLHGAGLQAGDIMRAQVADMADLPSLAFDQPMTVEIMLGDALYRLVAACTDESLASHADNRWPDCHIDLFAPNGSHSRLVSMKGYVSDAGKLYLGSDASTALLFAGDLDGDGRLDLLLDTSDHYNVRQPTLFLSGEAEGQPVRAVAQHRAVGC